MIKKIKNINTKLCLCNAGCYFFSKYKRRKNNFHLEEKQVNFLIIIAFKYKNILWVDDAFTKGQLSIIAPFEVYVSKMTLEGESHKNNIH